jgi:hypothetical protein
MSADGSWSVCTHEHLPDRFPLLCYALATALIMSADGLCIHEHLMIAVLSALLLATALSCQQMVHGVFALMNICQIAVPPVCATALVMSADGSWSVCTHEHLTDRCSSSMRLLQR